MKRTKLYRHIDRKLFQPLGKMVREGITPHKMALTVALGTAFGIIPVFGGTTIFCLLVAFIFGLNKPAILLINLFVYPLQLLFYVPFIHIGEYLFGFPHLLSSFADLIELFRSGWLVSTKVIWIHNLLGVLAWLLIMIPVSLLLYFITKPLFDRVISNMEKENNTEAK